MTCGSRLGQTLPKRTSRTTMPRLTQRQSISRWPTTTCELAGQLILPTDLLAYASRQPGDRMRTAGSPHTARVSGQPLPVLDGVLRILLLPCTVACVQLSPVGDSYVCADILCKPRNLGLDDCDHSERSPGFDDPKMQNSGRSCRAARGALEHSPAKWHGWDGVGGAMVQ